jgi:hypothetical protein
MAGNDNTAAVQFSIVYVNSELFFSSKSTLYQDAAKTTPATNTDDPVGNWPDISGHGRDATGAAGVRPLLKKNIIGTTPGILFDGSNDQLATASFDGGIGFGDYTQFIVCNGSVGNAAPIETGNGKIFLIAGVPACYIGNWMGYTLPTDTNAHVVAFRINSGVGVNAFVDSVKDASNGLVPTGSADNTPYLLGGLNYPYGSYLYGFCLCKGTLSDAQVGEVSDALTEFFLPLNPESVAVTVNATKTLRTEVGTNFVDPAAIVNYG